MNFDHFNDFLFLVKVLLQIKMKNLVKITNRLKNCLKAPHYRLLL